MNTNNISQTVSAGVKKIALVSLVFLTAAIFTVVAMNGTEKKSDPVFAAAADVKDFATCQANGGILGCADAKTQNCTYTYTDNGAAATKGPYKAAACKGGCYKGLCLAPCTYSTTDPKGKEGAQCAANSEYCNKDSLCRLGCYGYDVNGQLEVTPLYEKTCSKPGQDASQAAQAPDAAYMCSAAPKFNISNKQEGNVKNWIINSDGSRSEYSATGLFYDEADESQVCNYADCYNKACTGNNESDNLCSKTAAKIKAAFEKYLGYKTSNTVKSELDKIKNNSTLEADQKDKLKEEKIKEFKELLLSMLNSAKIGASGDNPDSGKDAEMMRQLEKMIFPENYSVTENMLWGGKNDGSLPVVKSLKRTQISCQYLSGNVTNSWCPADPADDFSGFSYPCVDNIVNGCDMFGWVNGDANKCKVDANGDPVTIESFPIWQSNGYKKEEIITDGDGRVGFVKDDNGWGGKVTGGAGNGCAYYSYVSPTGYQYDSTNQIVGATAYSETNKGFTGECWSTNDAEASVDPGDTPGADNKIGCAAPATESAANNSGLDGADSTSTAEEKEYKEGAYTCQNKKPFVCQSGDWVVDTECTSAECKKICEVTTDGTCAGDEDCGDEEACVFEKIDSKEGKCGAVGCYSPANSNKTFADKAIVCQSATGDSLVCSGPTSISRNFWETNETCDEEGCDMATGECTNSKNEDKNMTGKCADISINAGTAQETTSSKCGNKSCSGVCVPFTVKETGQCTSMTCLVTNDYDNSTATGYESGSGWYACLTPKSNASNSRDTSRGDNPDKIDYKITCTDKESGQTDDAKGSCDFPGGDDNPFSKEEEEAQDEKGGAKEGESCKKDDDCESGLVCEDGKCIPEDEAKAEEGETCAKDGDCKEGLVCKSGKCINEEDANVEAPTVTINSPTGTVTSKTAQLSVTTSLNAVCKYMDITNGGSFTASNFSGSGMTMSSSGYTHVATLNSLAESSQNASSDCKKTHNVVVLCQNGEAKDQNSIESIGSAQASFTVDLSANAEYAPTVTSSLSSNQFTVANPVLKVVTNMPAKCQYKEGGAFTYGSGTDFTTSGNYFHNTELSGLTSKDYTYSVVCRDVDTCAANPGLEIKFKVVLEGGESTMTIASATAETQTVSNPTISVTTDIPATCQYSTASFTYGSGTQFTNDNDYSHTSSLTSLPDGKHTFYVACKEKESGAVKVLAAAIVTTLERGGSGPVVSNTTSVSQSTSTPILSVTTETAAKCQYGTAEFTYGSGTQFTTDGGTGHSVQLKNVEDGEHTYYIVCKDVASGEVNSEPVQIVFEVKNTAATCADLDSNDRESDENRDYDSEDSESKYVWRSVENGERDEFTNVDWYAGYQFTIDNNGTCSDSSRKCSKDSDCRNDEKCENSDGYVTQLCGYFAEDQENEVILYNGSYKELTKATIEGTDDWQCVSVSPVSVKTDKRYYVVARVDNAPIYYEYESGLLPADADNVVVESGVRQLAEEDFGEDIFKYDYMVFGLVDVKIIFAGESEEGPEIEVEGPIGSIDENYTTLEVTTDENAGCKFSREDVEYSDMEYDFGMTGEKSHAQKICKLDSGNFTFYVRCKNEDGDENDASSMLQFEVSD